MDNLPRGTTPTSWTWYPEEASAPLSISMTPSVPRGPGAWHRLRRPHVAPIRQLLQDHYQPATVNRMLAALRGVLRE